MYKSNRETRFPVFHRNNNCLSVDISVSSEEGGFYYLINRYYDPTTGRFISPDDVCYLDFESFFGTNRYAYCLDDPVNYIDPTGHFSIETFIKGLGNIITGVLAIGAGAIVLIGGAPVGMIIVAGITLTAGVLHAFVARNISWVVL